ncbi:MAG: hypothetical protein PHZ03_05630 [Syntrophomonas sp.]|nr:hypothetical protein [Syntrophomonas sp.]
MGKKRGRLAVIFIVGVWAVVTSYFAYLHTFTIMTCYLDETITLDDRQYIIQEVEAFNFENVFAEDYNYWALNVLYELPVSLQRPFYEVVNFYSRPRIAYNGTWEVNIKGVVIPRLPEPSIGNLAIYIDGNYHGRAVQQPDKKDYSFFNTRGQYYSAKEIGQPITLIFDDKSTGHKTEIQLVPQWKKKYYFMELPADMATDPADTARKFFALASQGKRQEALQLVMPEYRNKIPWPPSEEIWNKMNPEDVLNYSLERQENQSNYPVLYALTIGGTVETAPLTVNMIKNQDYYEIVDFI